MSIENTNVVNKRHENDNLYNANHSTAESGCQVDKQTLEENISDKVRRGVENAVATVGTEVHEAVLSGMDNLVVPSMELAMRSVGILSVYIP